MRAQNPVRLLFAFSAAVSKPFFDPSNLPFCGAPMKVHEIMTAGVATCHPYDTADSCAKLMARYSCGAVPVVDDNGHLVGIVTDRDLCLALGDGDRQPSETRIADVMSTNVRFCGASDSIETCLDIMADARVRRLPVTDRNNKVIGIVSLNDIVLRTGLTQLTFNVLRTVCKAAAAGKVPGTR